MADEDRTPTLANLVRLAREQAGMTQQEAADAIGLHKNQWQNFEKGEGRPDLYTPEIERAFNLGEGWFRLHRDPLGYVAGMADDIRAIRKQLNELELLVRRALDPST